MKIRKATFITICGVLLGSTLVAQGLEKHYQGKQLIFEEHFNDNAKGWPIKKEVGTYTILQVIIFPIRPKEIFTNHMFLL